MTSSGLIIFLPLPNLLLGRSRLELTGILRTPKAVLFRSLKERHLSCKDRLNLLQLIGCECQVLQCPDGVFDL